MYNTCDANVYNKYPHIDTKQNHSTPSSCSKDASNCRSVLSYVGTPGMHVSWIAAV